MANVFDTAKYILEKSGSMSTMKLQKLCYYSQAWALVWDDAPLFNEDFQAWANGPVCPELFIKHRETILQVRAMKPEA
ncbi:type II toxin-antitoxin system antitoxin SocA domain-containing protein [Clostridium sp. AF22-10]|uniref:Panacea domain-containing protein n=1 Tax=Clostridium sp. AF22-10 TaxID=2293004 RepID=UPI00267F1373